MFMSKGLYFPFSRCKNTEFSANIKQYLEKNMTSRSMRKKSGSHTTERVAWLPLCMI